MKKPAIATIIRSGRNAGKIYKTSLEKRRLKKNTSLFWRKQSMDSKLE